MKLQTSEASYTSDIEYFEGISEYCEGVRLLMLRIVRPAGKPWKGHMTKNDATKIIKVHPEQVILSHFGMQMIFKGPAREVKLTEKETGVPTIAAKDGMRIRFGETICIQKSKKVKHCLNKYF